MIELTNMLKKHLNAGVRCHKNVKHLLTFTVPLPYNSPVTGNGPEHAIEQSSGREEERGVCMPDIYSFLQTVYQFVKSLAVNMTKKCIGLQLCLPQEPQ